MIVSVLVFPFALAAAYLYSPTAQMFAWVIVAFTVLAVYEITQKNTQINLAAVAPKPAPPKPAPVRTKNPDITDCACVDPGTGQKADGQVFPDGSCVCLRGAVNEWSSQTQCMFWNSIQQSKQFVKATGAGMNGEAICYAP